VTILGQLDQTAVVRLEADWGIDFIHLAERPGLKLYVVGHTDGQGDLSHNMNLSQGRAKAVVDTLVKEHGIDAKRLESHGVGPPGPPFHNEGGEF